MGSERSSLFCSSLRAARAAVLLSLCLLGLGQIELRAQTTLEQESQKAIYLRKILSFVEWPAETATAEAAPFDFCVEGEGGLGFALSKELRLVTLNGRKVAVRWVKKERELQGCQALVVGTVDEKEVAKLLAAAKAAKVPTFGQAEGFLDAGGMLQFSLDEKGFRFAVDLQAARVAGVKLDARLLVLAKRVVNGGRVAGG